MTKMEMAKELRKALYNAAFESGRAAKENELHPDNPGAEFSKKSYEDGYADAIQKALELLIQLEA